ncbi:MAG: helix-turn-helix transcriptional regulator [Erysipelotrichales bacterium]|nr:helix-turn-helix transcriptional regulator [Erysipelotrichales bacterium]
MIAKKNLHKFEDKSRILLQAKEYICLSPHANLKYYISNYSITFPEKDTFTNNYTVIPCGCSTINIEFKGNDLIASLDGPSTKPYIMESLDDQVLMLVTIEFKPAGLYIFTGIDQSQLADQTIDFEKVNPTLNKLIIDIVRNTQSIKEIIEGFDNLLMQNICAIYHPLLKSILKKIFGNSGNTSVKNLAEEIHYSERQLNRIFQQYVGVSAKAFLRLVRINQAFKLLKKPYNSLTFVSDFTGFHDLSHFIRDFKLVSGVTPQEYQNNMSAFYNNITKF